MHYESIALGGQVFDLLPQKAIYWPGQKSLLIADLHLGKINHFRKSGYAVPSKANDENTTLLIDLINVYKPERTIFLGDLFHSHYNEEWEVAGQVMKHFYDLFVRTGYGNHDIMSSLQYERHHIKVHEQLVIEGIVLTHEPLVNIPPAAYNLAGHIHPGARLIGNGKQSLTLPCFHFGNQQGILPAFGSFYRVHRVTVRKTDRVFVIADGKLIKVSE